MLKDIQLPTVLSMMAIPTHDLLRIHHRYPVLAFLLSLCNPSTFLSGLSSLKRLDPGHHSPDMLHSIRSPTYNKTIERFFTLQIPGTEKQIKLSNFAYDFILHLFAVGLASIMVWQAVLLGIRGVIGFACWTWHEPFTWVGVGGLTHLLSTVAWRLCLGPIDSLQTWSRWNWSLSRSGGNLELAHPHWARFFDLVFQIISLMNYGYGTAIFSGTSLVSPLNGLTVFCLMGFSSMSSRLLAIWILEVVPEVAAEDAGTLMVDMNGSETESKVELLRMQSRTGNERI